MQTFATFVAGGTNVFTPRVDAEELCRLIDAERCTGAFLVGPTIKQMLEVNRDRRYDLKSLRVRRPPPEWNEMITLDTEPDGAQPRRLRPDRGDGHAHVQRARRRDASGSHGRTAPGVQVRIVDPDDVEVPDGEIGEIVARGPTVMNGYWNRPEETARRLRGGWHHTNDLGRREADGSLTFIGPEDPDDQVGGREHLPGRGRGRDRHAPGRRAVRGDRRPRPAVDPEREGDRRARTTARRRPPTRSSSTAAPTSRRTRSRVRSSSSTQLPRDGFAVDYDALDAQFGGGGYPGAKTAIVSTRAFHARPVVRMGDPDDAVPAPDPARHGRARRRCGAGSRTTSTTSRSRSHHDGEHVTGLEMHAVRWPWATCPDAGEPLQALVGMELSDRCTAVAAVTDPRHELHAPVRPRRAVRHPRRARHRDAPVRRRAPASARRGRSRRGCGPTAS